MVIFIILVQLFSTFFISRHINELLKLCGVPKSIIFANLKEESGNFDFHTRGYCCVVCCHFLSDNWREKRSMPLTGLRCCVRVLKILAAHQLKIAVLLRYSVILVHFFKFKCFSLLNNQFLPHSAKKFHFRISSHFNCFIFIDE